MREKLDLRPVGKLYAKIDIFLLNRSRNVWEYYLTTQASKTCIEAKKRFLSIHAYLSEDQVKTRFSK